MSDASKSGYHAVMDEVMAAEAKGIGAYEMCIASVEELYRIALDVFHGSACASTPKDAAHGTVKCFIQCGMDVKRTEEYAKSMMFALMF